MPRPSNADLAWSFMVDLLTDARHAYKCARAVARGEAGYGLNAPAYLLYASQAHAGYKALRNARGYRVGPHGEVAPSHEPRGDSMTTDQRTALARLALQALADNRPDDARHLANKALAPDAVNVTRYSAPMLAFLLDFCAHRGATTKTWE